MSCRHPDKQQGHSSALLSSCKESKSEPQCVYCSQSHPSSSCSSVPATASRRHILKSNGRCFNCLRRGHVLRACRSSFRCQKCKKKHHTSICEDGQSRDPAVTPRRESGLNGQSQDPALTTPKESGLNPGAASFQSTQPTKTLFSGNMESVLLQTARADIYPPVDPHTSYDVRLILDSGSQKSYISERA